MVAALPFAGFYQLGFIGLDLDAATAKLAARYGVAKWRRKRHSPTLETAHAYAGAVMIEVICATDDREIYRGFRPDAAEAVRLHHHGFRVADADQWAEVQAAAAETGFACFPSSAYDGGIQLIYLDTRPDLGIWSEYVYLSGAMMTYYDDVPRN